MFASDRMALDRRNFLEAAALAAGLLSLPGCATIGEASYVSAVRRLLRSSTQDAFSRLTEPNGFWDSAVARINMPELFGKRGTVMEGILSSEPFRHQLQHRLNIFAEEGARRAAPVVADAVRTIGIANAVAILKGGPTAATTLLRNEMGPAVVNAMIPELEGAMRKTNDPILNQAISLLADVDLADAAHALAIEADNAIWYEIGAAEAEIRENPERTNDPILIGALKAL